MIIRIQTKFRDKRNKLTQRRLEIGLRYYNLHKEVDVKRKPELKKKRRKEFCSLTDTISNTEGNFVW